MTMASESEYEPDLLLILPRDDSEPTQGDETYETGWWQQVGHGILGTEAMAHGWKVRVLDASTYDSQDEFERDLKNYRPRVLGLTPSITNGANTLQAVHSLRDACSPVVILGGHLVSQYRTLRILADKYSDIIDLVCIGDGRGVFGTSTDEFLKWTSTLDLIDGNVVRLSSLKTGSLSHAFWKSALNNSLSSPIEIGHPMQFGALFDLNRYWRKYERNYLSGSKNINHKYSKPVAIQTMQGCPYRSRSACVFCNRMEGNLRCVSPEIVIQETETIRKCGGDSLIIVEDSGILASKRNARILAESWPSDIGIVFMYAHVRSINEEAATILRKLNCERVFIGVESGDELALRSLGKSYTRDNVLHACRILNNHGIMVSPSFIVGAPPKDSFPGENKQSIERTVLLANELKGIGNCDLAFANVLIPYDGSTAYEMLLERLPDSERARLLSDCFPACLDLQDLWCRYVLPITYDQALAAKQEIEAVFPLTQREYKTIKRANQ